jgi:hypothetical protein
MMHPIILSDLTQWPYLIDESVVKEEVGLGFATGSSIYKSIGMGHQGTDPGIICLDKVLPGIPKIPVIHAMGIKVGVDPLL